MDQELELAKNTPGSVILDVRNPDEYHTGHIPQSVNIPLNQITTIQDHIVDKDTPLFVYCLSGSRSKRACKFLEKIGYTKVTDLGGISDYYGELIL
ncbi:rhodanese-like domain-containing protein [Lachnospiraceae bacterium LCP25S3_G4]